MAVTAVSVRKATPEDADAFALLCTQLGYPTTADQVRRRLGVLLGREDHALLVAEIGTAGVIGWVHVYLSPLVERDVQSEIGGLVVDEAHRGSGAGKKLMEEAEAWTRQHGGAAVCLRSNVVRTEAHAFYNALGYQLVKTSFTYRKPVGE